MQPHAGRPALCTARVPWHSSGMAAGFIACAVLLAASIQAVHSRDSVPEIIDVILGARSTRHP